MNTIISRIPSYRLTERTYIGQRCMVKGIPEIRELADEAREQLIRYSKDECVAEARQKGKLKLTTVVWRSWELVLMEEVS